MKSSILFFVVAIMSGIAPQNQEPAQDFVTILQHAYENQQSNIQIQGEGVVTRLLADDLVIPRHQRFIVAHKS